MDDQIDIGGNATGRNGKGQFKFIAPRFVIGNIKGRATRNGRCTPKFNPFVLGRAILPVQNFIDHQHWPTTRQGCRTIVNRWRRSGCDRGAGLIVRTIAVIGGGDKGGIRDGRYQISCRLHKDGRSRAGGQHVKATSNHASRQGATGAAHGMKGDTSRGSIGDHNARRQMVAAVGDDEGIRKGRPSGDSTGCAFTNGHFGG